MAIVGRGHADEIDRPRWVRFARGCIRLGSARIGPGGQQLLDRIGFDKADERIDPAGCFEAIFFGSLAGAAGDGGQLDSHDAERRIVQRPLVDRFEKRAIGFFKNHPQANHAARSVAVAVC